MCFDTANCLAKIVDTLLSSKYIYQRFTLVELLVVIAIVLILVSLLQPALHSMRGRAQQITCANNLRSIYNGVAIYAEENYGYIPQCSYRRGASTEITWRRPVYASMIRMYETDWSIQEALEIMSRPVTCPT